MPEVLMAAFVAASILALYFHMEMKAARRALASYVIEDEDEINDSDDDNAEQSSRFQTMLGTILNNTEFLMSAIDDLKTAIAALITEGVSDISALVAKINAQSNQDPAIVALTTQVTDATAAMHTAVTAVTEPAPAPAPDAPAA